MQVGSKWGLAGALAISVLVSCGGSSGNGGSSQFTTSVPPWTSLTSLTSQQKVQLCADVLNYRPKVAPEACKRQGLLAAEGSYYSSASATSDSMLQMACTAGYNSCLSPDGGAPTASACDSSLTGISSACTFTVGDLTTCLNMEITLALQEDSNLPSCSSLTMASLTSALAAGADAGALSATCMTLNSNCSNMVTPSTVGFAAALNGLGSARK